MVDKVKQNKALLILCVTLLCPPVGFVLALVGLCRDFDHWKTYIFCVAWGLAVFAYCYAPTVESDMVRYFQYLDQLKGVPFAEAATIDRYGYYRNYSFIYYCWILANLGLDRLMPAIPVFFIYYTGLYVTFRVGTDLRAKHQDILTYAFILLLTLNFFGVENNVRNVSAFCMITLAVFRETYLKKRDIWTLIFYIFPVFLHMSAFIFLLLRVLVGILHRIRCRYQLMFLFIALIPTIPNILQILSEHLIGVTSDNLILHTIFSAIKTANAYYTRTEAEWAISVAQSGSEQMAKVLYSVFTITVLSIILLHWFARFRNEKSFGTRVKKCLMMGLSADQIVTTELIVDTDTMSTVEFESVSEKLSFFVDYEFFVAGLTIAVVPMVMPEYWRFVSVLVVFGGVFYLLTKRNVEGYPIAKKLLVVFLVLAPLCAALWGRNWILYTDAITTLLRAMVCNPIVIFIAKLCGTSLELLI